MLLNLEVDEVAYNAYKSEILLTDVIKLYKELANIYPQQEQSDVRDKENELLALMQEFKPSNYKSIRGYLKKFKKYTQPMPYEPMISEEILTHIFRSSLYGNKYGFDTSDFTMSKVVINPEMEHSLVCKLMELYILVTYASGEDVASEMMPFVINGLIAIRMDRLEDFISRIKFDHY